MKIGLFSLSGAKALMMSATLLGMCASASAGALVTLKGNTPEVKLELQSELRLSVLNWTDDERGKNFVAEFERYQRGQQHGEFQNFLQSQETLGYLFTQEATGHTIKYAWQEAVADDTRMVLVVTPALKTRNPYLWKQRNDDPAPYSLLELHFDGEKAVMKSSLDTPVVVNAMGKLELQDYEQAATFATLRDDTPYYLRDPS